MSTPEEIKQAKEKQLQKLRDTPIYKAIFKLENEPDNPVGRPKIITTDVLQKLYEAFIIGSTDEEACFYAEIATQTLYNFQKEYPEFLGLKEQWKQSPILKARNTIYSNLDTPENARWFLERKKKDEFASRSELSGVNGIPLLPTSLEDLRTNYANLADGLDRETKGQGVENDTPVLDKEQTG